MPLEVGVYGPEKKEQLIKKLQVNEKSNTLTFSVDFKPERLVLDPNFLVLMEVDFEKK